MASKYTVKRLEPETVIAEIAVAGGVAGAKSPRCVTYAVVSQSGFIAMTNNILTGKPQFEIYPQRAVAGHVAAGMNRRAQ